MARDNIREVSLCQLKNRNKFWECAHRDVRENWEFGAFCDKLGKFGRTDASEHRARDTKGAKRPPQAELVSAEEAGAIA